MLTSDTGTAARRPSAPYEATPNALVKPSERNVTNHAFRPTVDGGLLSTWTTTPCAKDALAAASHTDRRLLASSTLALCGTPTLVDASLSELSLRFTLLPEADSVNTSQPLGMKSNSTRCTCCAAGSYAASPGAPSSAHDAAALGSFAAIHDADSHTAPEWNLPIAGTHGD
eukprot:3155989-Prymnesium_polylepis.1